MDTIFAQATARGKAGVSIIRVSGLDAAGVCKVLAGFKPKDRGLSLRNIQDADGLLIDRALVLWFPAGQSFTGEDVLELQLHGSPAIVSKCLATLSNLQDLRVAKPGEFTRRALENNRLDLAQVEGLADLIEAETEAQRLQALRVFDGALGAKVDHWRTALIRAASLIEVTIDFADEEVPEDVTQDVVDLISSVEQDLQSELADASFAERVRDGFEVVILGPPNIGKSTLLNRLAGRDAAITSSTAGTTRDVIEVRMDVDGFPVTFVDTAGLREATEEIEAVGIGLARKRAAQADLRIVLTDDKGTDALGLDRRDTDIVLRGKADLDHGDQTGVSGKTGHGINALMKEVSRKLGLLPGNSSVAIRQRHRDGMLAAVSALISARERLENQGADDELVSEDLRQALASLEELIGRVGVESLLDEIFSSFCLGK